METTKRIAKKVYFAELAEFCEQNPTVVFSDDIDASMMQALLTKLNFLQRRNPVQASIS